MKRYLSTLLALVLMQSVYSQSTVINGTEDFFQAIGKMYVVVAIILIIFIGLGMYLWRLDQRLKQLEKKETK